MSSAIATQGTTFFIGAAASPLTQILEVNSFTGIDGSASLIDVTHLSSLAKEKRKGLLDNGKFSLTCNFLAADPGQVLLQAARASSSAYHFRVILSDSTQYDMQVLVMSAPISGGVDSKVGMNFTLEITGAVTQS
ncbi:hypothetical protein UFOVP1299_48 [uncultured Caudovirales phage]|uniref:Phage tail protein n=1 Tax=uncultured Caudovirales phage TaxID=2100421 RepID=A0A6J5RNW6_9CAUD|nr:hypothetical protein UFOVP1299_48 [uncultured Caudovirales phage]